MNVSFALLFFDLLLMYGQCVNMFISSKEICFFYILHSERSEKAIGLTIMWFLLCICVICNLQYNKKIPIFSCEPIFSAPSQLYFFDTLFKIHFENLNFFRRKTITFMASPVLTKLKFVILSQSTRKNDEMEIRNLYMDFAILQNTFRIYNRTFFFKTE